MPECKSCHQRISKLDKDICPFCGTLKPLEGVESKTVDITQALDPVDRNKKLYRSKSKIVATIITVLFGPLGLHGVYLNNKHIFWYFLIGSIVSVGGIGSILGATNAISWLWAYLIPYFVMEGISIIYCLLYFFKHDYVDGHGEFLR